jgi:hypothetical protein
VSALQAPVDTWASPQERSRLRFSFQAASLRQAVAIAAEMRARNDVEAVHVHPAQRGETQGRQWTVALTTHPVALSWDGLRDWESDLVSAAQRRVGCRPLGWTTCGNATASRSSPPQRVSPAAPTGPATSALSAQPCTQRQLVSASLLCCRTRTRSDRAGWAVRAR